LSAESDLALVVSPANAPEEELALSGPSAKVDPLRLPCAVIWRTSAWQAACSCRTMPCRCRIA
jgi:hypothetical protein